MEVRNNEIVKTLVDGGNYSYHGKNRSAKGEVVCVCPEFHVRRRARGGNVVTWLVAVCIMSEVYVTFLRYCGSVLGITSSGDKEY